jgi:hypothetical protein
MPPDPSVWMVIPLLSSKFLTGAWPYIVLPLDFILGIVLLRHLVQTIRDISNMAGGGDDA